ncbi:hypothetical protein MMC26_007543 [Xylographa opegraphella]|nr:hypothetical protein [Xylographa opegraphella]
MPAPRRKSGNAASTARSQQPLSFHVRSNKITKPSVSAAAKSLDKADAKKLIEAAETASPSPAAEEADVQIEEEPTTAELAIRSQVEAEKKERTDAEVRASKITDAQVKRYWKKKEDERKAPRVHQQGLSVEEKVLREFDLSSQFGPCVGIARTKRWKRAEALGLQPPLEVLAVLLKAENKNSIQVQRAYMDELIASKFITS